jgi:predicted kinase
MPTPLVLTGGPAVGKSTTGRLLARRCTRAAFIDVDDIRQLVIAGGAAPWEGAEGLAQQELGVLNTCGPAERFHTHDFQVVIADVLTQHTAQLYRRHLPGCVIVRLHTSPVEVRHRAGTRTVYLTDDEFEGLHAQDRQQPPAADHHLDVTPLDITSQVEAVQRLWTQAL